MKPGLVHNLILSVLAGMMFTAACAEIPTTGAANDPGQAAGTGMEDPGVVPMDVQEPAPIELQPGAVESADPGVASVAGEFPEPDYRIQPGDVLNINVWKETDLQGEATVLPDGMLSFPLVGYLQAEGMTLADVRDQVRERLSKYIPEPVVTVSIARLSGNQIYVIGNVARPGAFAANRKLDVMQLLSIAGGMTTFAAVNKVKILRRENGVTKVIPFRYRDVEKGENLEQNIILQGGDVVVVP